MATTNLASTRTNNSGKTPKAALKPLVLEDDFKDLRFRLAHTLQSSLDINIIIEQFFNAISASIHLSGISYQSPCGELVVELGTQPVHSAQYSLTATQSTQERYGKIIFFRAQRFLEPELVALESMIGSLIYPLRNGLLYRDALQRSMQDPLTGIANRAAMDSAFIREMKLARRHGSPLSLLVIDIDHFKKINDSRGHQDGDKALRHIVKVIQYSLRDTDQVFRYGGEEFVVLLNNTNAECAKITAERIRENIALSPIRLANDEIFTTISVGIANASEKDTVDTLFVRADQALYQAKSKGRNKVVCLEV